jgi:L-ascorbate metabolism protein UlaG (beta-lactamase superfamily)
MRITWFGHAAFLIETPQAKLIIDPYRSPDCGGYLPIEESADIVIVSHENDRYHSHLGQIIPPFLLVKALELPATGLVTHNLRIGAVRVFETPQRLPGDEVTLVQLESESIRLAFLGDLGHALAPEELAPVRGAHVLLVPVGGPPTIDLALMGELLEAVSPKLVIPMHFKIEGKINLPIQPLESFIEAIKPLGWGVEQRTGSSLDVDSTILHTRPRVVCLSPAR